jgi:hypothetical protein
MSPEFVPSRCFGQHSPPIVRSITFTDNRSLSVPIEMLCLVYSVRMPSRCAVAALSPARIASPDRSQLPIFDT